MNNHGTLKLHFNKELMQTGNQNRSWWFSIMTIQMDVRVLHFTLSYSLTRKPNFRCTATSVSRKILLCFCEPSQTFTPFWRVTFSEHFLKEWSFTFFGKETSNLVDGNISIEKNVFTTQRIISCEDFGKRIVFAHELYFKSIGPHEQKKKQC